MINKNKLLTFIASIIILVTFYACHKNFQVMSPENNSVVYDTKVTKAYYENLVSMSHPRPLLISFSSFQVTAQFSQQIYVGLWIRRRDSNSLELNHESPPITTRPVTSLYRFV